MKTNEEILEEIEVERKELVIKLLATFFVCLLGGFSMWITGGKTGIGWTILGLLIIWFS